MVVVSAFTMQMFFGLALTMVLLILVEVVHFSRDQFFFAFFKSFQTLLCSYLWFRAYVCRAHLYKHNAAYYTLVMYYCQVTGSGQINFQK